MFRNWRRESAFRGKFLLFAMLFVFASLSEFLVQVSLPEMVSALGLNQKRDVQVNLSVPRGPDDPPPPNGGTVFIDGPQGATTNPNINILLRYTKIVSGSINITNARGEAVTGMPRNIIVDPSGSSVRQVESYVLPGFGTYLINFNAVDALGAAIRARTVTVVYNSTTPPPGYCDLYPDAEKCNTDLSTYCQKNPDDARCVKDPTCTDSDGCVVIVLPPCIADGTCSSDCVKTNTCKPPKKECFVNEKGERVCVECDESGNCKVCNEATQICAYCDDGFDCIVCDRTGVCEKCDKEGNCKECEGAECEICDGGVCITCDENGTCERCDGETCVVCDKNGNCEICTGGVCQPCGDRKSCNIWPPRPPTNVDCAKKGTCPGCESTKTCNPPCLSSDPNDCNSTGGVCVNNDCGGLPKFDPDNPVVTVCWGSGVDHLFMTIKNTKGEVVHTKKIPLTEEEKARGAGCKDIEIRFDEEGQPYGLPAGLYTGRIDARDVSGKNMGEPYYFAFFYKRSVCKGSCDSGEPPRPCAGKDCSGQPEVDPKNPVVTMCYEDDVTHIDIVVKSEKTGEDVHSQTIWLSEEDRARGCKDIEIRLDEAGQPDGLPAGWYIITGTKKNDADKQVGKQIVRRVYYAGRTGKDGCIARCGEQDPNNPVITICYESNVTNITVTVRNDKGEVVHVQNVPITEEDRKKGSCKDIEIYLDEANPPRGLPPGWYEAEFVKKDKDGNQVGATIRRRFWYDGLYYPYFEAPLTGSLWVGRTRIPRAVVTITGLVLAFVAAAIFVIKKRLYMKIPYFAKRFGEGRAA